MAVSYYKIINGKRYDRQMLKVVEEAVAGQDGKPVSLEHAKRLYKTLIDGNRITKIERETLAYIEDNFTFESEAEKWLKRQVAAWDKKKSKKWPFSFSDLRILRTGPIVQPSKAAKKAKKKARPEPPKTKVTIDLKSIGKRPKRKEIPKEEEKPIGVETPLEQTDRPLKTFVAEETVSEVPPVSESKTEEVQATDIDQIEASSDVLPPDDDYDESKFASTASSADLSDQSKKDPAPGSSITPVTGKEKMTLVEQVPTETATKKLPKQKPMQAGFNTWKLYAVVCLLLVPIAFFVGRGFEPIPFTITKEKKAEETVHQPETVDQVKTNEIISQIKQIDQEAANEVASQLKAKDIVIANLKTENKRLQEELESTTAVVQASSSPQEIKKAETKRKISTALTDQLSDQFSNNLIRFDKDKLWLTFLPSESYFDGGSARLNPPLKQALRDFFPNFVETLLTFEDDISEIRFQGHASSVWRGARNPSEAYLKNLSLSSARAEAALTYCLGLQEVAKHKAWLEDRMVSSGFADQKPVLTQDNTEDPIKSRRITISVGVAAPKQ